MSYEYKEILSNDFGIKEKNRENWKVIKQYRRIIGKKEESDWECYNTTYVEKIIVDTIESLRAELDIQKARNNDLELRLSLLESK
jgi:hypothetical protein